MRVEEVAKRLNISTRHVFRLVEQGKLRGRKVVVEVPVKVTRKEVLDVDPESVEQYQGRTKRTTGRNIRQPGR